MNVAADIINAVRDGTPLTDAKLEALRRFTETVVEGRGWVSEDTIAEFRDSGYDSAQILDVIVGITLKTLSNYTDHIVATPLDDAFSAREWKKAG